MSEPFLSPEFSKACATGVDEPWLVIPKCEFEEWPVQAMQLAHGHGGSGRGVEAASSIVRTVEPERLR